MQIKPFMNIKMCIIALFFCTLSNNRKKKNIDLYSLEFLITVQFSHCHSLTTLRQSIEYTYGFMFNTMKGFVSGVVHIFSHSELKYWNI